MMGGGDAVRNIVINFKSTTKGRWKKTITNVRDTLKTLDSGLQQNTKQVDTWQKNWNKKTKRWEKIFIGSVKNIGKMQGTFGQHLKHLSTQFQAWALSIMFFGMAIQRVFSRILRSAVTTFTRVMEASDMQGSAIQRLAVHWEYLKFVVGSAISRALEPLMPVIIRVINALSEWIQKHTKLAAALIIGGLGLGAFLKLLGMFTLGAFGVVAGVQKIGAAIGWLGSHVGWASIGTTILWAIAIIVVLVAAWKANLGNMQNHLKNTVSGIWTTIKSTLSSIWEVIKALFDLVVAFFEGDADKIKESFLKLTAFLFEAVLKLGAGILMAAVNIVFALLNIAKDLFAGLLQLTVLGGENLAKALTTPIELALQGIKYSLKSVGIDWNIPSIHEAIDKGTDRASGWVKALADWDWDSPFSDQDFEGWMKVIEANNRWRNPDAQGGLKGGATPGPALLEKFQNAMIPEAGGITPPLPTSPTGEQTTFAIENLNVEGGDLDKLMQDVKRYAAITNIEL